MTNMMVMTITTKNDIDNDDSGNYDNPSIRNASLVTCEQSVILNISKHWQNLYGIINKISVVCECDNEIVK